MIAPRRTSVIILITLAELAWLAAFGLLFAYRGKIGELGKISGQLQSATNRVDEVLAANQRLREQLVLFDKYLRDVSPDEAARRLANAAESEKKVGEADKRLRDVQRALAEKTESEVEVRAKLTNALSELTKLRSLFAALPPNLGDLEEQLRLRQARVAELEKQLFLAQTEVHNREVGEFSVRRELTGLPDGNLRRVVFLVDTSASMRNSPAWDSARKLIRTWLEFLPVEECALVNFNDNAVGFPERGYHRVRQPDGTKLSDQREQLLRVFDQAHPGTYTDLMRGLRRAYEYPTPDVMVLFTDGHPHIATQRDASFASDIFKEVGKHRGIPILTVALGTYEIEGADGPRPRTNAPIAFLKKLARQTGGNFLAR